MGTLSSVKGLRVPTDKNMVKTIHYILLYCLTINIIGCTSDDILVPVQITETDNSVTNDSTEINTSVNKWILRTMKLYYYWADDIPYGVDTLYNISPQDYFPKLLHNKDRFSWISNTKESNDEKIYGSNTSRGFECVFFYADSSLENLIAEVIYTYPCSQAEANGIKRGMYFKEINGTPINVSNYKQLLNEDNAYYQFLSINDNNVIDTLNISVTQEDIQRTPFLASSIIPYKEHNIGYLCYKQFLNDDGDDSKQYRDELINLFSSFRKQQISDIVIDLRYNTGGDLNLSVLLGSMLVPKDDTAKVALEIRYNDKLTNAYSSLGYALTLNFNCDDSCYVGDMINNIVILTGPNTASASENLINMLLPYKKPIIIGTKTYGKNYGSQVITSPDPNIKWTLQPITMKIFNSLGLSDFDNGFIPDYEVDELSYNMKEFGTIDEPLMNKSMEVISGKINEAAKAKGIVPDFRKNYRNLRLWKYNIDIKQDDPIRLERKQ